VVGPAFQDAADTGADAVNQAATAAGRAGMAAVVALPVWGAHSETRPDTADAAAWVARRAEAVVLRQVYSSTPQWRQQDVPRLSRRVETGAVAVDE
jgi:hypothetical protein